MTGLRESPPSEVAGFAVTIDDLSTWRGQQKTDAVILSGGDDATSVRVVARPSGTEPKLKCYIEVRLACADDVGAARTDAARLLERLTDEVSRW